MLSDIAYAISVAGYMASWSDKHGLHADYHSYIGAGGRFGLWTVTNE